MSTRSAAATQAASTTTTPKKPAPPVVVRQSPPPPSVCVIVLGDIGRSPRMQYHASSLLQHGYHVDIVGYVDSEPLPALRTDPNAHIHPVAPFPATNLPRALRYLFKTVWALLSLLGALLYVRRPRYVLVQNPPAIPALIVCTLYCALTRARLIIDWHNYTHTILALETGGNPDRLLVRVARWIERHFGAKSADNLCVTRAMRDDLRDRWSIGAHVFYDRPPVQFRPIGVERKHELFERLAVEWPAEFGASTEAMSAVEDVKASENGRPDGTASVEVTESTAFTLRTASGAVQMRADRPGLLVSSTSWTPDEDFAILLKALDCEWLFCVVVDTMLTSIDVFLSSFVQSTRRSRRKTPPSIRIYCA